MLYVEQWRELLHIIEEYLNSSLECYVIFGNCGTFIPR
jgi:hypothetical protein